MSRVQSQYVVRYTRPSYTVSDDNIQTRYTQSWYKTDKILEGANVSQKPPQSHSHQRLHHPYGYEIPRDKIVIRHTDSWYKVSNSKYQIHQTTSWFKATPEVLRRANISQEPRQSQGPRIYYGSSWDEKQRKALRRSDEGERVY